MRRMRGLDTLHLLYVTMSNIEKYYQAKRCQCTTQLRPTIPRHTLAMLYQADLYFAQIYLAITTQ